MFEMELICGLFACLLPEGFAAWDAFRDIRELVQKPGLPDRFKGSPLRSADLSMRSRPAK